MATRLSLAKSLTQEAAITQDGSTLVTTLSQTGEFKRVVDWIDRAYRDVQNESSLWLFLRKEFSYNLTSGTANYAATTIASDFATWLVSEEMQTFRLYKDDLSDEQIIYYLPWRVFRDTCLLGSQRTDTGRPVFFTIKPDKSIQTYPVPDDTYTLTGEYFRTPDVMDEDEDEPIFPARFHDIILYRALGFYGVYSAEPDKELNARDEYSLLLRQLKIDQLPTMQWGSPLA